ncbi:MAG: hypothetical protein C4289_13695, partial [Chloroflexota bacterium]
MFQSLRVRLVVTYALIALLSLAIGGAAFLVLLRGYQQERDVARLREHTLFIAAVMQSPQARAAQLAERVIEKAVERMITRGPLGRQ